MEFRDPLGPAAKQFLPRLQSAFLVETAALAERLARENPAYSFVTPDGTSYQGRVVSGGRPSEAGPLGMKRELRSLDAEVLHLERAARKRRRRCTTSRRSFARASRRSSKPRRSTWNRRKLAVAATLQRDQARGDTGAAGNGSEPPARPNLRGCANKRRPRGSRAEAAQQDMAKFQRLAQRRSRKLPRPCEREAALRQSAQAQAGRPGGRGARRWPHWPSGWQAPKRSPRGWRKNFGNCPRGAAALVLQHDDAAARRTANNLPTQTAEHQRQVESLRDRKIAAGRAQASNWKASWNQTASARPKWTTPCAWRGRSSATCGKNAASTKSSAPATIPSASTCGNLASRN